MGSKYKHNGTITAIAAFLWHARKRLNLSTNETSNRSGVCRTSISKLENGAIPCLSADNLAALADTLGLKREQVFALAGHKWLARNSTVAEPVDFSELIPAQLGGKVLSADETAELLQHLEIIRKRQSR